MYVGYWQRKFHPICTQMALLPSHSDWSPAQKKLISLHFPLEASLRMWIDCGIHRFNRKSADSNKGLLISISSRKSLMVYWSHLIRQCRDMERHELMLLILLNYDYMAIAYQVVPCCFASFTVRMVRSFFQI